MAGGIKSVLFVCSSCTTARQCARSGACERNIKDRAWELEFGTSKDLESGAAPTTGRER